MSLKNVNIPDNVKTILIYAFAYCISLEEIEIPSSVEVMGGGIFIGCTNLTIICNVSPIPEGWHEDWDLVGFN